MSRSRLFFVLASLEANDTGDEIVTLLGRLSRARLEPRVIALGERDDLQERIVEMKVRVYPLGLSGLLGTASAIPRSRRLLKDMHADVVHGFGAWGGAVARLAAPRGVPVVRSVSRPPNHDSDARGRLLQMMEGRARSRLGTRFIVPNEASRGLAVRAYGAPDGHVSVLPTSVDVTGIRDSVRRTDREHARVLLGVAPGETAFVLVTGFESAHTMDEILEGFLTASLEKPGLRMFILGSGRHESETRWRAEQLRLGDSVVFLGRGTDQGPIWAAADAAIDASPWSAWSRGALIAMAAGVPVVKRRAGEQSWPEDVGDEFPMISAHPDRFAIDLVGLASSEEARQEIAERGKEYVKGIDARVVAERLDELYASLLPGAAS